MECSNLRQGLSRFFGPITVPLNFSEYAKLILVLYKKRRNLMGCFMEYDKSSAIVALKKDPAVRKLVMECTEINTLRQLLTISFDWLVIAGVIAASLYFPNMPVYLFSILVIASRQHALFVVMHDGAHYRISKNLKTQ